MDISRVYGRGGAAFWRMFSSLRAEAPPGITVSTSFRVPVAVKSFVNIFSISPSTVPANLHSVNFVSGIKRRLSSGIFRGILTPTFAENERENVCFSW